MKQPLGLLGVGLVGRALIGRLRTAGFAVCAYDPAPASRQHVIGLGAEWIESEREVARTCRRVILSLPGPAEVRAVMDLIAAELRPGDLMIDTTTGDPKDVEAFARLLAERQVWYLDATLGGSSRQIATGEAIVICGGPDAGFSEAAPILHSISDRVFHTGPPGSGTRMKLVLNLVLGLQRAVLAEALEFANRFEIEPDRALTILKASPAYATVMDTKGEKMLRGDFHPEARLAQHAKDVRLMLQCGMENGAFLPLTRVHDGLLREAVARGWGPEDNSAIIKLFQRGGTS
ncbi:MAG TPA: NAD(P)-dependent oxidoreductase [Bryobacteraceae bacterium]|nr:NAD(P)-dependent oxidoreductase [Bryobacteraceae bacterium]